ncbi:AbrB/MazE/SpoVT family DNA-binding domain-containing protein [Paenibacillus thailandensis]|uniref:AbrB/MazE/SpoVT family DNA-binding domain-containing protein n=1 Tax=Paenibacillus thailandensis TaxID=393250 RepID=A0ABW5QSW1_9BACL
MLKATGIVRRIDDLGRVVIPMELRRTLEIGEKDPLEIFVNGDQIILRKYEPGCTFCGVAEGDLKTFRDKLVCTSCAAAVGR